MNGSLSNHPYMKRTVFNLTDEQSQQQQKMEKRKKRKELKQAAQQQQQQQQQCRPYDCRD